MKLILLSILGLVYSSRRDDDLVTNLPGLIFNTNFDFYSGYLNAGNNGSWRMHYVLTESQSDPVNDPVLLWLNGGPGCSSFSGLLGELGPYYVNYDGQTLFENVYAWNKKANVLAIESPIGVGFSYDNTTANYTNANDDQTALQNYNALIDFFKNVRPDLQKNPLFLSGESYAGIYIPTLSKLIVDGVNDKTFPNQNFRGAAIGNGFMHVKYLMNSLVLWGAYHARISQDEWARAKQVCQTDGLTDHDKYDYTKFMKTTNGMDYVADNSTECGRIIDQLITDSPASSDIFFDQYNYYQDCYSLTAVSKTGMKFDYGGFTGFDKNTAKVFNYDSTDPQFGYPCWSDSAIRIYLNRPEVQAALHIEDAWKKQNQSWKGCNDPMYDLYNLTYATTNDFFNYVIQKSQSSFRFLIYNGDVDTVCNYLGDSWFIQDVARDNNLTSSQRKPWFFGSSIAGYNQNYVVLQNAGSVSIDVLTVKGAGHFVPNDRPGVSLQMITNFMFDSNSAVDYSSTSFVNSQPKIAPLKTTKTTAAPPTTVSTTVSPSTAPPCTVPTVPTTVPTNKASTKAATKKATTTSSYESSTKSSNRILSYFVLVSLMGLLL
ncbi:unnamed protein product [Auanema sp. JU1783]|nr:unnamed protein product [Auanema sp. JU1783]